MRKIDTRAGSVHIWLEVFSLLINISRSLWGFDLFCHNSPRKSTFQQLDWDKGKVFQVTKRQLLPRVWGESEVQHRHGGYQEARHDQVVEVIQSSPSQLDHEGDVQIRLRAAVVDDLVSAGGNTFNIVTWDLGDNDFATIMISSGNYHPTLDNLLTCSDHDRVMEELNRI